MGLDVIADGVPGAASHGLPADPRGRATTLDTGGLYQWRKGGEYHMWNPDTVAKLQHAVRIEQLQDVQGIHEARQR